MSSTAINLCIALLPNELEKDLGQVGAVLFDADDRQRLEHLEHLPEPRGRTDVNYAAIEGRSPQRNQQFPPLAAQLTGDLDLVLVA
ncbi:hypothetical protein [Oceanithermus sp.]